MYIFANGVCFDFYRLTGSIPSQIGNLSRLKLLVLSNNELNKKTLFLLSGIIPTQIGNLVNLTHLILDHNQLSGTIPKTIENLHTLQYLVLNHNKLSGELPALHKLPPLTIAAVNDNMLSGTIPFNGSFNWDNLKILSMENNMFSGKLPKLPNQMNTTSIFTFHMNQFSDHNLREWLIFVCLFFFFF
ncbi:hypothetical protein RFI_40063 [Reticulomyxa filosa]|uniref:Uncharacterized protein n=1 Tax=Reticulomyxa filosa TaxID=46433 RepID=X6L8Q7_RETFI|nr:hypothetical protein RFI_40063 [Reticulomyxa filosa]|eukprot:ETN97466.1 hypothetical protein RFI_40063 [Reticulomyxa filosa]